MREISAVDNENTKNLQVDSWRMFQLMKFMAREDHPFHKFSTGNAETLDKMPKDHGLEIRKLLLDFYEKHYSANMMKFTVYGKESLDTLQAWATERFGSIVNKDLQRLQVPSDPYTPLRLQKIIEVVPVKDLKCLDFYFPIPEVESLYETKPTRYINHLLGHESDGSILSALKSRGYANGLSSFLSQSFADFASLGISIELTDAGVLAVEEIIECVFAYIGMLRREGPKDWIAQEVKDVADMNFRYVSKTEPSSYATSLANNMQIYPSDKIISGASLVFKIDLGEVERIMTFLSPQNCMAVIRHKGVASRATKKEEWYGTKYTDFSFTSEQQIKWGELSTASGSQQSTWSSLLRLPQVVLR